MELALESRGVIALTEELRCRGEKEERRAIRIFQTERLESPLQRWTDEMENARMLASISRQICMYHSCKACFTQGRLEFEVDCAVVRYKAWIYWDLTIISPAIS